MGYLTFITMQTNFNKLATLYLTRKTKYKALNSFGVCILKQQQMYINFFLKTIL